ncbi:hypothetical protein [Blastococcus sp. TF02A-35]|uniref:hypothetical protein n=1 Tax=Blastococcus sp. TF02A-35 TaxID=2559612 RepID=UPI00107408AF|nr:hypothetical protein [Blastococcus sp. TF02A_35]TFV52886.1 hypothetical protein E4P43_04635 [Blastococcus sp. TF02A_35]
MASDTLASTDARAGRLPRVAALAGAACVVVTFAGISASDVGGNGVNPTMGPDLIASLLRDHVDGLRTGASLLSVGALLAVLFAGPLWLALRQASEWVAAVGAAGAVLAGAHWLSLATDGIGLATAADLGDGATAQVLVTTGWESARITAVPSLVMVTAALVAGFGHGCFPRWYRWFTAAVAVPLVVALAPVGPAGLLGFAFGGGWLLVTSLLLTVRAPAP